MKYLNTYKLFESIDNQFFKTYEDTKNWLDQMDIKSYSIEDDLTVNVDGDIYLSYKNLGYIPVQFGIVNGDIKCCYNQLKSLKGCPKKVEGFFNCSYNLLTSFDFCPEVTENFFCSWNPVYEIYELFNDNPKCIQWINEYKVIRLENDKWIFRNGYIILENFKEVIYMMDIKNFDYNRLYKLKNYKVV